MNSLNLIEALSNANGSSGFEDEVVAIAENYAIQEGLGTVSHDCNLNVYINNQAEHKKPVIMLDAHSDEVGFMVQHIKPDGTLGFLPVGGLAPYTVPAHKVRVQTYDGKWVPGIVSSRPVHFHRDYTELRSPDFSEMSIDVGATSIKEVKEVFNIHVGAPVVPDVVFEYNEMNNVMLGKAFDNRLGCAALLETMNELKDVELDVDVVGLLASQEEVGDRGVATAVPLVKPDISICFEGCPADDTFLPEYQVQTALKKGPMLRHFDRAMITNPRFQRFALELARELDIPVQEAVRAGGGTDGSVIHVANGGVPVIVIGVPVRYAHSHHGISSMEDYQNAVKLAVEIIKRLNKEIIDSF